MASALEIGKKFIDMESWESSRDIDSMWEKIANCIREITRELFGMTTVYSGRRRLVVEWINTGEGREKEEEMVESTIKEERQKIEISINSL